MQKVTIKTETVRADMPVDSRIIVEQRSGDIWSRHQNFDLSVKHGVADERTVLLGNNQRIVIESRVSEAVVYDPQQMAAVPASTRPDLAPSSTQKPPNEETAAEGDGAEALKLQAERATFPDAKTGVQSGTANRQTTDSAGQTTQQGAPGVGTSGPGQSGVGQKATGQPNTGSPPKPASSAPPNQTPQGTQTTATQGARSSKEMEK